MGKEKSKFERRRGQKLDNNKQGTLGFVGGQSLRLVLQLRHAQSANMQSQVAIYHAMQQHSLREREEQRRRESELENESESQAGG